MKAPIAELRPGEVLQLSGRPSHRDELEMEVAEVTISSDRCLIPPSDVWQMGAVGRLHAAQDVEVDGTELLAFLVVEIRK